MEVGTIIYIFGAVCTFGWAYSEYPDGDQKPDFMTEVLPLVFPAMIWPIVVPMVLWRRRND